MPNVILFWPFSFSAFSARSKRKANSFFIFLRLSNPPKRVSHFRVDSTPKCVDKTVPSWLPSSLFQKGHFGERMIQMLKIFYPLPCLLFNLHVTSRHVTIFTLYFTTYCQMQMGGGNHDCFFIYFWSFQTLQFLANVKNIHVVSGSRIQTQDHLNQWKIL